MSKQIVDRLRESFSNRRLLVGLAALVIFAYGSSGGCAVQRVPPAPTQEQQALLREPPLPYTVAVVPWSSDEAKQSSKQRGKNPRSYTEKLADALKRSGAFRSVELDMDAALTTDLVAISRGDYCNTAVIPLWSIVSLGLYPTIFDETDCLGVIFRGGGGDTKSESAVVKFKYEGRVIMGWIAMPMAVLEDWERGEPRSQTRYSELLRLAILQKRDAISGIAGN